MRITRILLTTPIANLTHEQEYMELKKALQSDARLTSFLPEYHSEQAFRIFLQQLLAHLDSLRPWSENPSA